MCVLLDWPDCVSSRDPSMPGGCRSGLVFGTTLCRDKLSDSAVGSRSNEFETSVVASEASGDCFSTNGSTPAMKSWSHRGDGRTGGSGLAVAAALTRQTCVGSLFLFPPSAARLGWRRCQPGPRGRHGTIGGLASIASDSISVACPAALPAESLHGHAVRAAAAIALVLGLVIRTLSLPTAASGALVPNTLVTMLVSTSAIAIPMSRLVTSRC